MNYSDNIFTDDGTNKILITGKKTIDKKLLSEKKVRKRRKEMQM